MTTGAPSASCATSFVQAFGRAAFRTNLGASDARVGTYSKLFMMGTSNADGAQMVVSAMLQSPFFLYRSELGTQSGSTYTLTPYEVATELAYTLTGTTPDTTLLTAADAVAAGSMPMSSMIDQQANRLTGNGAPTNATAIMGFVNGWLGLPRLFTTAKDNTVYAIAPEVQNDMAMECADPDFGGLQRNRLVRLGADRRSLVPEPESGYLLRAAHGQSRYRVHQRQVRLGWRAIRDCSPPVRF